MEKLRVAIFTDTFVPRLDGVVVSTINLAKGLADRGYKVSIIAPKHTGIKEKDLVYPNINIIRISGVPTFFYENYFTLTSIFSFKVLKYLKKEKIDVIHFQTPFSLGVMALLIAKRLKKPLVGTFHTFFTDPQYIKHVGLGGGLVQTLSWEYATRFYNNCDIVTCPSESAKRELLKHNFSSPIKVISNGIDKSIFDNRKWKKIKTKYNLKEKNLLFVGRITHAKNIDYLLECLRLVVNKDKTIKLLIVGEGPQMEDVEENIKKLRLSENVILLGRIEHSKLVKSGIFKACNLFVTASTTESQGITLLEAQANGMVCVGVRAKGVRDLIKDNYNGRLAKAGNKKEFAEKILELLNNKKIYRRMQKNTLEKIKEHDMKKVIDKWETMYNNLIKQ